MANTEEQQMLDSSNNTQSKAESNMEYLKYLPQSNSNSSASQTGRTLSSLASVFGNAINAYQQNKYNNAKDARLMDMQEKRLQMDEGKFQLEKADRINKLEQADNQKKASRLNTFFSANSRKNQSLQVGLVQNDPNARGVYETVFADQAASKYGKDVGARVVFQKDGQFLKRDNAGNALMNINIYDTDGKLLETQEGVRLSDATQQVYEASSNSGVSKDVLKSNFTVHQPTVNEDGEVVQNPNQQGLKGITADLMRARAANKSPKEIKEIIQQHIAANSNNIDNQLTEYSTDTPSQIAHVNTIASNNDKTSLNNKRSLIMQLKKKLPDKLKDVREIASNLQGTKGAYKKGNTLYYKNTDPGSQQKGLVEATKNFRKLNSDEAHQVHMIDSEGNDVTVQSKDDIFNTIYEKETRSLIPGHRNIPTEKEKEEWREQATKEFNAQFRNYKSTDKNVVFQKNTTTGQIDFYRKGGDYKKKYINDDFNPRNTGKKEQKAAMGKELYRTEKLRKTRQQAQKDYRDITSSNMSIARVSNEVPYGVLAKEGQVLDTLKENKRVTRKTINKMKADIATKKADTQISKLDRAYEAADRANKASKR